MISPRIPLLFGVGVVLGLFVSAQLRAESKTHDLPKPTSKSSTVVGLCDGETSVEVKGLAPGSPMPREQAQAVSNQLMADWLKKHPDNNWEMPILVAQKDAAKNPLGPSGAPLKGPAPSPTVGGSASAKALGSAEAQGKLPPSVFPSKPATLGGQGQSGAPATLGSAQVGIYTSYTSKDEALWRAETEKFVKLGDSAFHDAEKLGGTIGVSCDMCHPNAANTHPETYPKYQVQLQRVALLRDMINWCIENPLKGKPLKDDDPKLRALEAYIYAQRKGVALNYGKH